MITASINIHSQRANPSPRSV